MSKFTTVVLTIIAFVAIGSGAYYFFSFQKDSEDSQVDTPSTDLIRAQHLIGFEQSVNSNNWSESQKYLANNVYVVLEGSSCCGEKKPMQAAEILKNFRGLTLTFDENDIIVREYLTYIHSQYPSGSRFGIPNQEANFDDLVIGVENDRGQSNKATLGYKTEDGRITVLFINPGRDRISFLNKIPAAPTPITSPIPTAPVIPTTYTASSIKAEIPNLNIGTMSVRVIVANIDEVGNKYGSYGMKFAQSKLAEVDQAIQRLNIFIRQSSYGNAQLQWITSGVYELGSGVCNQASYSDKVNNLVQRALVAADSQNPLADYSYYIIVHPMPDCPDGENWSFEGRGQFKAYTLNGKTVHLRGIHISDLSDQYLFHEFGHSLAYQPNTGIGHPDFMNCPVVTSNKEVQIAVSSACPRMYDSRSYDFPTFTIMSASGILSDYSIVEKEIAGWVTKTDIVETKKGDYTLSPLEQIGPAPKGLKIPVAGTTYTVYVSFRQPSGYTYPDTPPNQPNGVILDVSNGSITSFLVTDNANKNAPLKIGFSYRLGTTGPVIKVNSISYNLASITVSSE